MNKVGLSSNLVSVYDKILGIWFFLILKVKQSVILNFQVIDLVRQKSAESLHFFSLKNSKKVDQILSVTYFHKFDFKCTLFSKIVPNFLP